MHLLFINRFFHPDLAATSRVLTELAEGLVEHGATVTVLTGRVWYSDKKFDLPSVEWYRGVRVRRVWSTGFGRGSHAGRVADYLSFYLSTAWTALCLRRIDCLVVLSDPPMLSVLAVVLRAIKGWKAACWLHDVFPEIALRARVMKEGRPAELLQSVAHWSLRVLDRVIVLGRCMERHLLVAGVSRERLTLITGWADGQELIPIAPNANWFRRQHGLDGRIVAMYSGNLGEVHETESIIAICRRLCAMPDVCVLFIGGGSGKAHVEECVSRERLGNVRFLGYQDKEHLRYSLSAGDIHFVTLRADMTGLSVPSKVYGIMAVGRPVIFIGPKDSEVGMLVREAGCGEVYAPEDTDVAARGILALAQDHRRREALGASGRRYFEMHLEKQHAIRRFHTVLHRIVQ